MDYVCIEDFLDLSVFRCKLCYKRCGYPVMVIEKNGNYCSTCSEGVQGALMEENKEINNILEKLIVPCKFYKTGCNIKRKFVDMKDHENICKFRSNLLNCPFSLIQQCDANVCLEYCEHFNSNHNQYITMSENGTIKLHFRKNDCIDFCIIRVLIFHNEYFLLHVKLNPENKKILLAIYFYGTLEELKNYKCTVQREVNTSISTQVDLLHESEFIHLIERTNETYCSFNNDNFDEINLIIKINTINGYDNATNIELLKTLECPRCGTYLRGKIHQCNAGHIICILCSGDPLKCLECNALYTGLRNYALENLSDFLRYPCRYKCSYRYYSSKNLLKHEESCYHQDYCCPLMQKLDCQWIGKYNDINHHLQSHHQNCIVQNNTCIRKILLCDIDKEVLCFITFDNVFVISIVKMENRYCFKCKHIAPATFSNRFMFEIGLINEQNKNNKLIVTNSWFDTNETLIEIHNFNFSQYVAKCQDILISFQISYKINYINFS